MSSSRPLDGMVKLHGLVARPELNGAIGTVVESDGAKPGRLKVQLLEPFEVVSVKQSNAEVSGETITSLVLKRY